MTNTKAVQIKLDETARLLYHPKFIPLNKSNDLLNQWTDELHWVQSKIKLFGQQRAIPRLNAWYGEKPYSYSGVNFTSRAWTPEMLDIKQRIESFTQSQFNSVLANYYRNGQDCMGWHSDDEKSLGENPLIASVSLGATRRFTIRNKSNKSDKQELPLEHGSLLLMLGTTQADWQHAIPRTKKCQAKRINLTFRTIV